MCVPMCSFYSYVWDADTPLLDLLRKYCNEQHIWVGDHTFLYKHVPFALQSTPAQLKMEDGDKIGVLKQEDDDGNKCTTTKKKSNESTNSEEEEYQKKDFDNIPDLAKHAPFNRKERRQAKPGMCSFDVVFYLSFFLVHSR